MNKQHYATLATNSHEKNGQCQMCNKKMQFSHFYISDELLSYQHCIMSVHGDEKNFACFLLQHDQPPHHKSLNEVQSFYSPTSYIGKRKEDELI